MHFFVYAFNSNCMLKFFVEVIFLSIHWIYFLKNIIEIIISLKYLFKIFM